MYWIRKRLKTIALVIVTTGLTFTALHAQYFDYDPDNPAHQAPATPGEKQLSLWTPVTLGTTSGKHPRTI